VGTVDDVVLLVLAAAGGCLAGRARRPAGGHGPHPRLRRWPLLAAGLALLLLAAVTHDDVCTVAYALGLAAVAAFCGANWQLTGLLVVGLGVVLNLGAVVLDNGVPVRPRALVQAHAATARDVGAHHVRDPRHLETGEDEYGWLGDVIPVPLAHQVISWGDLLVLVGLFDVARDLARRRARPPEVDDEDDAGGAGGPAQPAATTQASVDQVWGTAPSGVPSSGSQCSAKPVTTEADIIEFWRDAALPPDPAHRAARQSR
jgi:hypothetical protein